MTSFTAYSIPGEHIGITAPFEIESERTYTLLVLNVNDETRTSLPDEANDLSAPGTHFDRQPHTHHSTQKLLQIE